MKNPRELPITVNDNGNPMNVVDNLELETPESTYKTYKIQDLTPKLVHLVENDGILGQCRRINTQLVVKCLEIEGLRLPPREREEQRHVFLVLLKDLRFACQSSQGFHDPDNPAAAFAVSSFGDWISRVIKDDATRL